MSIEFFLGEFLLFLLVIVSTSLIFNKNLFKCLLLLSVFSFLVTVYYCLLGAPDVAITEAAVGSAISAVFFCIALKIHHSSKTEIPNIKKFMIFVMIFITVLTSFLLLLFIPDFIELFGNAEFYTQNSVKDYYISEVQNKLQFPNIVAGILASFRGFDTMLETTVIMMAGVGILLILYDKNDENNIVEYVPTEKKNFYQNNYLNINSIYIFFIFIAIFAFYIQIYGEKGPGGGFQSGILLANTFIVYGLIFKKTHQIISVRFLQCLTVLGVAIYFITGLISIFYNKNFLNYDIFFENNLHIAQAIGVFSVELGVGITVFSSMLLIFSTFNNFYNSYFIKNR